MLTRKLNWYIERWSRDPKMCVERRSRNTEITWNPAPRQFSVISHYYFLKIYVNKDIGYLARRTCSICSRLKTLPSKARNGIINRTNKGNNAATSLKLLTIQRITTQATWMMVNKYTLDNGTYRQLKIVCNIEKRKLLRM